MRTCARVLAHGRAITAAVALAVSFAFACEPKDFESAFDAEEGAPFGGGARGGAGSTPTGGSSGTGDDCGDITEVGVCMGDVIRYCEDGMLVGGDCRTLDPSCRCAFDEEKEVNDCICGAGGGGAGGTGGAGNTGGGGTRAGAGGSGATAGTSPMGGMGGRGGTAGTSGAAGASGGQCGGISCMNHSECCAAFQCVSFTDAPAVCAANCSRNSACASGCCATLRDYTGACGPIAACGGTGCRPLGASCDVAADCCATTSGAVARCIDVARGGPRVCSAPCTIPSNCTSNCCLRDSTGVQACAPAELCQ